MVVDGYEWVLGLCAVHPSPVDCYNLEGKPASPFTVQGSPLDRQFQPYMHNEGAGSVACLGLYTKGFNAVSPLPIHSPLPLPMHSLPLSTR